MDTKISNLLVGLPCCRVQGSVGKGRVCKVWVGLQMSAALGLACCRALSNKTT